MKDRPGSVPLVDIPVAPSGAAAAADPERARIAEGTADQPGRWRAFGPYLSEREWGTVLVGPGEALQTKFRFTPERIVAAARETLARSRARR